MVNIVNGDAHTRVVDIHCMYTSRTSLSRTVPKELPECVSVLLNQLIKREEP
jgi:hypothetical protein